MVDYVEASTLGMDCSNEFVEEHTAKMLGSLPEDDMDGCKSK